MGVIDGFRCHNCYDKRKDDAIWTFQLPCYLYYVQIWSYGTIVKTKMVREITSFELLRVRTKAFLARNKATTAKNTS